METEWISVSTMNCMCFHCRWNSTNGLILEVYDNHNMTRNVIYLKHGTQFYTLVTEYSKTRRKPKLSCRIIVIRIMIKYNSDSKNFKLLL